MGVMTRNTTGEFVEVPAAAALALSPIVAGAGLQMTAAGVLSLTVPGFGAPVAITTVGAGIITRAALLAGLILRSGPVAAYTDTTDSAADILAAMDDPAVGFSWTFEIVNGVAFVETLAGGAGITLAGVTANAPSKVRRYRAEITNVAVPAIKITGIGEMVA